MPFVLLIIGIVLLTSAIRNTQDMLVLLLRMDFVGPGNFLYWIVVALIIGAVGTIDSLRKISDGLMVLMIVTLFLTQGTGFFDQLTKALKLTTGGTTAVAGGTVGVTLPVPNPPVVSGPM